VERAEKREVVTALHDAIAKTGVVVVAHYAGLSVSDMTKFRRDVRGAGGHVKVAKNRLAKLALEGTNAKGIADYTAKVIEFSGANTSSAFDFLTHLMGTKSPSEVLQLSATHGRKNFEATTAQSRELWELARKVTTETAEPIKKGFASALQKAS
jgi:phasin